MRGQLVSEIIERSYGDACGAPDWCRMPKQAQTAVACICNHLARQKASVTRPSMDGNSFNECKEIYKEKVMFEKMGRRFPSLEEICRHRRA